MSEVARQDVEKPRPPRKKRSRLAVWLVFLLGVLFLGWELYALIPGVRVAVVNVLGWIGSSAMPLVVGFCEDESRVVRAAAANVLVAAKEEAVPALKQALTQPETRRRRLAADLLGNIGPAAAAAVPALAEAGANDPDLQVRKAAILSLGRVGGQGESAVQALIGLLEDGNVSIRKTALESLAQLGPGAKKAVSAVAKRLKDDNPEVRREAAEVLEQIGPAARAAIPALRAALADPDPGVVREVKEALEALGASPVQ